MSEPLMRLLAGLPTAEPDPARAERIRMRCRAGLARRAADVRGSTDRGDSVQVWQPLIAVLGAAYLAIVIVQALNVYSPP